MAVNESPRAVELARECRLCGTPLEGFGAPIFRFVGIGRSSRNPNLCTRCNVHAEEGRVVEITVLFADLTSFTELTQALGPERVHEVVDAFLRMATTAITRYDGVVDKYAGDAVMAIFNAPIRRPDHATQAVRAAQAIQADLPALNDVLGERLQVAVGIARGWARVGAIGSAHQRDYTAIGDVVNLAARLEGTARPGEIVMDMQVYEEVRADVPDLVREELTLKGFRDPVAAFRLGAHESSPPLAGSAPRSRLTQLRAGALIFAVLGAPCAAAVLSVHSPWRSESAVCSPPEALSG